MSYSQSPPVSVSHSQSLPVCVSFSQSPLDSVSLSQSPPVSVSLSQSPPVSDSPYAWQPIGGPCMELIGKASAIGKFGLECNIKLPLESFSSTAKLLQAMQPVFRHNFIASE